MAQAQNYEIVDEQTLIVRREFNDLLLAIFSSNEGPLEPPATGIYSGMRWYDSDNKLLKVRSTEGAVWTAIATGVNYLPTTGGAITGNLSVTGTFNAPNFDSWRVNYAGVQAPQQPVAGQLWFDSNGAGVLRIRDRTNSSFVDAIDMATPTLADAITITSTTQANLIFSSLGELRYLYNDAPNNRIGFWTPAGTSAYITDTGSLGLKVFNFADLGGLINAKQPALGFTPIRQTGGNTITVGGNPAHLYVDGVDQGVINYGAPPLLLPQRGAVGAFTVARPSVAVNANATVGGASLSYYSQYNSSPGAGTWRNIGGNAAANVPSSFYRLA